MRKFGRFVENLNGKYITAEDVNTTTRDMEYVNMETDHVVGLPESMGGGGDPSPVTAYGTFMGVKASAKHVWGNDSLAGKKVAIQGIGKVGGHLLEHLHKEGAQLFISDINEKVLAHYAKNLGATVVNGDEIYALDVDIFAPCAASRLVTKDQIDNLIANGLDVISCGANVPFADKEIFFGSIMEETDSKVSLIPDFISNCGMARVFAYFMEKKVQMTDEAIFYDISETIKKALDKAYALNSDKKNISATAFEIALKQLV